MRFVRSFGVLGALAALTWPAEMRGESSYLRLVIRPE
jgi:hypothetical protein